MIHQIDVISHPRHGLYKVWRDSETNRYTVTKWDDPDPTHCGYASVDAILKLKGLHHA